jgi:hypothetical protein
LVALLAATILSTQALAGDFWSVGTQQHYTTWDFVDASSIHPASDGWLRAWITTVVTGPGIAKLDYRKEMKELEFNCTKGQVGYLQYVTYADDNSVKSSANFSNHDRADVVPGSSWSDELSFVCESKAARASNKAWVHITVAPEVFADNAYKYLSDNFCTAERPRGCVVP